jgi:hypothetical protein
MRSSDAPMTTPSSPGGETVWRHVMHVRSPRAVVQTLRALVKRPVRHRRHKVLRHGHRVPPGLWWSGDDRWFPADFPPRQGNRLTPLVDGQEAMQAMYDAMEHACASIDLTGWFITPQMRMLRRPTTPKSPVPAWADRTPCCPSWRARLTRSTCASCSGRARCWARVRGATSGPRTVPWSRPSPSCAHAWTHGRLWPRRG